MDKQLLHDIANMSDEELIQFRNGIKIGLENNVGVPERKSGTSVIKNGLLWRDGKLELASLELKKEVAKEIAKSIKTDGYKRGCRS